MEDFKNKYRCVLKNNVGLHYKIYTIKQIELSGLSALFDVENYEIISRDRFTGLLDKNGVDIYEGDILMTDGYIDDIRTIEDIRFDIAHYGVEESERFEVIGNIHDKK